MQTRPDELENGAEGHGRPRVNVAGYFKGVMGVGEHARQLAGALRTQGIAVATFTLHPEAAPEDDGLATDPTTASTSGGLRSSTSSARTPIRSPASPRCSVRSSSQTATRLASGPGR